MLFLENIIEQNITELKSDIVEVQTNVDENETKISEIQVESQKDEADIEDNRLDIEHNRGLIAGDGQNILDHTQLIQALTIKMQVRNKFGHVFDSL